MESIMQIGGFYIEREPFRIIGVNFGKYKILEETKNYILMKVYGGMCWSGLSGMRYSSPTYNVIKKFFENNKECGKSIKYFDYDRKSKKERTEEMKKYWKEINENI